MFLTLDPLFPYFLLGVILRPLSVLLRGYPRIVSQTGAFLSLLPLFLAAILFLVVTEFGEKLPCCLYGPEILLLYSPVLR